MFKVLKIARDGFGWNVVDGRGRRESAKPFLTRTEAFIFRSAILRSAGIR